MIGPFQFVDQKFEQFLGTHREKRGVETYPNGSFYEGEWIVETNIREGKGRFYSYEQRYSYEGYWRHDKREGAGREIWSTGEIYEGNFSKDKKNG